MIGKIKKPIAYTAKGMDLTLHEKKLNIVLCEVQVRTGCT